MALIEVNHQELKSVASAIEAYCKLQDQQMSKADSQVQNLVSTNYWWGNDASQFVVKWNSLTAGNSTATRHRKSLDSYAKALKASAALYAKAQEQAYTSACWLPKVLW